ncbi:MAG: hypothetical protein KAR57_00855 [Bacteroidales bacterium]|nr:hypothetical protein [Bacteroidales bacterium]
MNGGKNMAFYLATKYSVYLGKLKILADDEIVNIVAGIRCSGEHALLDIGFIAEGESLPNNVSHPFNTAFRPISEYFYYLDILRNEKPVYIVIDKNDPSLHAIKTQNEPIGVGENRF